MSEQQGIQRFFGGCGCGFGGGGINNIINNRSYTFTRR